MAGDRRLVGVAAALAALVALSMWVVARTAQPRPGPGASLAPRASTAARGPAQPASAPVEAVRLDVLAAAREQAPRASRRNPFEFGARLVAPAPAPEPPAPPRPAAAPSAPAGPGAPAPIPLKFIGVVEGPNGLKLAVLTDGRVVTHGREGDIIEGRYRILKIGVESIELAHADGRGRQTIRLSGQ